MSEEPTISPEDLFDHGTWTRQGPATLVRRSGAWVVLVPGLRRQVTEAAWTVLGEEPDPEAFLERLVEKGGLESADKLTAILFGFHDGARGVFGVKGRTPLAVYTAEGSQQIAGTDEEPFVLRTVEGVRRVAFGDLPPEAPEGAPRVVSGIVPVRGFVHVPIELATLEEADRAALAEQVQADGRSIEDPEAARRRAAKPARATTASSAGSSSLSIPVATRKPGEMPPSLARGGRASTPSRSPRRSSTASDAAGAPDAPNLFAGLFAEPSTAPAPSAPPPPPAPQAAAPTAQEPAPAPQPAAPAAQEPAPAPQPAAPAAQEPAPVAGADPGSGIAADSSAAPSAPTAGTSAPADAGETGSAPADPPTEAHAAPSAAAQHAVQPTTAAPSAPPPAPAAADGTPAANSRNDVETAPAPRRRLVSTSLFDRSRRSVPATTAVNAESSSGEPAPAPTPPSGASDQPAASPAPAPVREASTPPQPLVAEPAPAPATTVSPAPAPAATVSPAPAPAAPTVPAPSPTPQAGIATPEPPDEEDEGASAAGPSPDAGTDALSSPITQVAPIDDDLDPAHTQIEPVDADGAASVTSAAPARGRRVSAPRPQAPAAGDLENTGAYDDLFGKTVFRSIEDAAVRRPESEDDAVDERTSAGAPATNLPESTAMPAEHEGGPAIAAREAGDAIGYPTGAEDAAPLAGAPSDFIDWVPGVGRTAPEIAQTAMRRAAEPAPVEPAYPQVHMAERPPAPQRAPRPAPQQPPLAPPPPYSPYGGPMQTGAASQQIGSPNAPRPPQYPQGPLNPGAAGHQVGFPAASWQQQNGPGTPGLGAPGHPVPPHPAPGGPAAGYPAHRSAAVGQPVPGHPAVGRPAPGHPSPSRPAQGLPAAGQPAPGHPAPGQAARAAHTVSLPGQLCAQGHANAPERSRCLRCGAPLDGRTLAVPRPPLGRLLLATGEQVLLDRSAIIGRRPRASRVSAQDVPQLITVPSPQQDISRSHLEVRLEGWHVVALDLGTTNGTTLYRDGFDPVRLRPREGMVLRDGDRLDLGDGVHLRFEERA